MNEWSAKPFNSVLKWHFNTAGVTVASDVLIVVKLNMRHHKSNKAFCPQTVSQHYVPLTGAEFIFLQLTQPTPAGALPVCFLNLCLRRVLIQLRTEIPLSLFLVVHCLYNFTGECPILSRLTKCICNKWVKMHKMEIIQKVHLVKTL